MLSIRRGAVVGYGASLSHCRSFPIKMATGNHGMELRSRGSTQAVQSVRRSADTLNVPVAHAGVQAGGLARRYRHLSNDLHAAEHRIDQLEAHVRALEGDMREAQDTIRDMDVLVSATRRSNEGLHSRLAHSRNSWRRLVFRGPREYNPSRDPPDVGEMYEAPFDAL